MNRSLSLMFRLARFSVFCIVGCAAQHPAPTVTPIDRRSVERCHELRARSTHQCFANKQDDRDLAICNQRLR